MLSPIDGNARCLRHIACMTPPAWNAAPPNAAALVAGHGRASILTADGELPTGTPAEIAGLLGDAMPLLVHAPVTLRRLGLRPAPVLRPAGAVRLRPPGLPRRTDPARPGAGAGHDAARRHGERPRAAARIGAGAAGPAGRRARHAGQPRCGGARRPHGRRRLGLGALRAGGARRAGRTAADGAARVEAPAGMGGGGAAAAARVPPGAAGRRPPPPGDDAGAGAEQRPGQGDYAAAAAAAFAPRETRGDPATVLAEAGTGTGKTLGYVAPASLWAERNGAPVWISTYTRHLQRQVEAELARLYPDPAERRRRVVVRKGRENYLCLLNLEDRVNSLAGARGAAGGHPAGAARALGAGDGGWRHRGRRPARLVRRAVRRRRALGLADRRGECIHGACPHYKRCFVEHTIRRARTAELVVANHALVMIQAAHGFADGAGRRAGRRRRADALRVRRGPPRVRRGGQRLRRRVQRHRGRGAAPLAAGCGGRRLPRARAAAPAGRAGRRAAGAGSAAGGRAAGRPRPAGAGLVDAAVGGRAGAGGLEAGQANASEALLRLVRHQVLARTPGDASRAAGRCWNATCIRCCTGWRRRRAAGTRARPHRRAAADAGRPAGRAAGRRRRRSWSRPPAPGSRPPPAC